VLHDFRGLGSVEIEEERGRSIWTRRLAKLERIACLQADLVSVVSEPFRELVVSRYGVAPERVVVVPTGVPVSAFAWRDEDRQAARAELGLGTHSVVAYVGSAAAWQLPELVAETAARLEPGTVFVVLSQDAADFRALAERAGLPADAILAREAGPSDVGRLLCAADAALLPRARSAVNDVAAPVKFCEYLAAGVPVVAVRGTGSFARRIEEDCLGALAEEPDAEQLASTVSALLSTPDPERRHRCRETAECGFDLDRIADRYVELYRELASAA